MSKKACKDSDIIAKHLNGLSYSQIGRDLRITRQTVSKVVKKYIETNTSLTITPTAVDELRTVIKLEITQENTLTELSTQLAEYTDEYNKATDPREKVAWSQNRLKIIDMMAKITGLYNGTLSQSVQAVDHPVIIFKEVE